MISFYIKNKQDNNFVSMISYVELLFQLRVSGTFLNGISLNLTL